MDYGSPEGAAVLVALDAIWCGRRGKEVLSIESRIAYKLEGIAVEAAGAGLGDDIYHAAGILSVFRAVVAGLHAEFLERVRERKRLIDVGVFVHVIAAIELVADGVLPRAVGRIRHGTGKGLRRSLVGASVGGVDGPRHQQRELRSIPAIQGQFGNALLLDDLLERGCRHIHLQSIAHHRNDLGGHTQLHVHVYRERLIREQGNSGFL